MMSRFGKACLVIALILLAGCATSSSTRRLDRLLVESGNGHSAHYPYRCTAGAHRGASTEFKENTLLALKAADRDPRYAFIEFDVQYSSDRKIVVFHDRRLLRRFGSLRTIRHTDFAELERISDGEIAPYDAVMDMLTKRLNIEIKSHGDREEDARLVDEIVADLKARKRLKDVMISSISDEVVAYIGRRYPEVPTGKVIWLTSSTFLPFDGLTRGLYDAMRETDADYLVLHVSNLRNIEDLLRYKPKDKTVMFWAFDDSIYIVHKDLSDRLWGEGVVSEVLRAMRYRVLKR